MAAASGYSGEPAAAPVGASKRERFQHGKGQGDGVGEGEPGGKSDSGEEGKLGETEPALGFMCRGLKEWWGF